MVYLPRHDRHKKKKSYIGIAVISVFFITFGIGIYNFREIQLIFSSDGRSKIGRLEKKISDEISKNKLSADMVKDYSKAAQSFLNMDMVNPEAFHFLALAHYYEIISFGFEIENPQILSGCVKGKSVLSPESKSFFVTLEKMYKEAKRADAFGLRSENSESNFFLILFYEIFRSSKKKEILAKELSSIHKEKLSQNIIPLFKKLGLFSACSSGDSKFLEKMLEEFLVTEKKELSPDEVSFLRGATFYNSNEFVKALEALRKISSSGNPILKKDSRILEAMIFFKQNLHEKSIELLEKEYEAAEKKDPDILKKIQFVVSSKKGLKSRFAEQ